MKPVSIRYFWGLSSFEIMVWFRRGLFYAYLSIYLRHFLGLSVTETTLFSTLPMALNILFQTFVWGRLSDRLQLRRTLIVRGEILAGVGTVVIWYAHRLAPDPHSAGYVIIGGLAMVEIFWSMSNIGWSALIADIYSEADRLRIQGRLASLGGLGRLAGVWIGGLLYDGLGQAYAGWGFEKGALFFVASGAMFLSTLPLLRLPEGGLSLAPDSDRPPPETAAGAAASRRLFIVFLIAMVFINFGRNSMAIIFTQYLTLDTGLDLGSRMLSNVVNIQSMAVILLGWLAGGIAARMGTYNALLGGTVIASAALILLGTTVRLDLIFIANFFRGMADVLVMASAYTLAVMLIPPDQRGRLLAWFNATFFLSWGLAGTLIAGPMVDYLIAAGRPAPAAYQSAFLAAAGLVVCGLMILLFLKWFRPGSRNGAL